MRDAARLDQIQSQEPQSHPLMLSPDPERLIIYGMTGTGKSTLTRYLIRQRERVLIVDPKNDFSPPRLEGPEGWRVYTTPDSAAAGVDRYQHILYRPDRFNLSHDCYDELFGRVFDAGDWTIDIDEMTMVCRGALSWPESVRALYQQGRSRGITVIGLSQEPRHIPSFVQSQCERCYSFYLIHSKDRDRAAEFLGPWGRVNPPERHAFWYRHRDDPGENPRLAVLRL